MFLLIKKRRASIVEGFQTAAFEKVVSEIDIFFSLGIAVDTLTLVIRTVICKADDFGATMQVIFTERKVFETSFLC